MAKGSLPFPFKALFRSKRRQSSSSDTSSIASSEGSAMSSRMSTSLVSFASSSSSSSSSSYEKQGEEPRQRALSQGAPSLTQLTQSALPNPRSTDPFRAPALGAPRLKQDGRFCLGLMGIGGAGKTTLHKQLMYVADELTPDHAFSFRDVIWSNITDAAQRLLAACQEAGLPLDEGLCENPHFETFYLFELPLGPINFEAELASIRTSFKALFSHPSVLECLSKPQVYEISPSIQYFAQHAERILQREYFPSKEDILRCHAKTTGLTELKGKGYRVYDTGGQRSERAKWGRIFPDLDAIIFMVSLADYDQNILEVEGQNAMRESLKVFQALCNHEWMANKPVVLIFNKKDLFVQKLPKSPLSHIFPDFQGETGDQAVEFIIEKFLEQDFRSIPNQTLTQILEVVDPQPTKIFLEGLLQGFVSGNHSK